MYSSLYRTLPLVLLAAACGADYAPISNDDGGRIESDLSARSGRKPSVAARSWVVFNHTAGETIASKRPDKRYKPASLTKLMTSYVVFTKLAAGEISLDDKVLISKNADSTPPTAMRIRAGSRVRLKHLLLGLIVQSGNDAAVALAEYIGKTERGFTRLMNAEAARLGMTNSKFGNASGLPTDRSHYSTARDLARLTHRLIEDFPQYYKYFSRKTFKYRGRTFKNRNPLLKTDRTVDGLKTGYTRRAGYCLIASAVRNGVRITTVVMGAKKKSHRESASRRLMRFGFRSL